MAFKKFTPSVLTGARPRRQARKKKQPSVTDVLRGARRTGNQNPRDAVLGNFPGLGATPARFRRR